MRTSPGRPNPGRFGRRDVRNEFKVVPRPNGRLRNRSKSLWKDVQKSMSLLEDIILDVDGT